VHETTLERLTLTLPAVFSMQKAVVADDEAVFVTSANLTEAALDRNTVFVTSANLTEAALDRNIELGVLIRDRGFALTIAGYFGNLIDRNLLKPLPLT
jgi:phosphatidylserine/phosphatidylglycerophosphate/cardiolipin synthase-like enzyme